MSNPKAKFELPPFDGHKPDFPEWYKESINVSIHCNSDHSGFVTSKVVTAEAYARLALVPQPAVTHAMPNALANNADELQVKKYDTKLAQYRQQQVEYNNFFMAVHRSLGPTVREYLTADGDELFNLSLSQVMTKLVANYGTMSATEINQIHDTLKIAYTPDIPLSQFIAMNHTKTHRRLLEAGERFKLNEHAKIEYLLSALVSCGLYEFFFVLFAERCPISAADRYTYTNLVKMVQEFTPAVKTTTGTAGFVAAMIGTSEISEIAKLRAQVASLTAQLNNQHPSLEYPNEYCHTHGVGFHASGKCIKKSNKHQDAATMDNRMNGNTFVAEPREKHRGYFKKGKSAGGHQAIK